MYICIYIYTRMYMYIFLTRVTEHLVQVAQTARVRDVAAIVAIYICIYMYIWSSSSPVTSGQS